MYDYFVTLENCKAIAKSIELQEYRMVSLNEEKDTAGQVFF